MVIWNGTLVKFRFVPFDLALRAIAKVVKFVPRVCGQRPAQCPPDGRMRMIVSGRRHRLATGLPANYSFIEISVQTSVLVTTI
jgi:hypothetical protein